MLTDPKPVPNDSDPRQTLRLRHINRLYGVLSAVNRAMTRRLVRQELLQEICRILVEVGEFRMAWFGIPDAEGWLVPEALCGDTTGYLSTFRVSCLDIAEGRGPAGTAIRENRPVVRDSRSISSPSVPSHVRAARYGFNAVAGFPVLLPDGVIACLVLYSMKNGFFAADEEKLLTEICADVEYALEFEATELRRLEAEGDLEREKNLFGSVVGAIPDLIWLKDPDGFYLYCNPAFERFFGASMKEIAAKSDYDFVDEELAAFFRAKDRETLAAGRPMRNNEWVTFADDGHRALLETIKSPLRDASGGVVGILGIARDITATRQVMELEEQRLELARQQQRLSGIIYGANIGTWEWNLQNGSAVLNERWAEIIGYTLAELEPVGIHTLKEYAHPDDLHRAFELFDRHVSGEQESYECELRMRHKEGEWVWVLDRGKIVSRDDHGRPLLASGTHLDITRRKQAEAALGASEQFMRMLTDFIPGMVGYWNRELRCGFANIAYQEWFGKNREEMEGIHIREMLGDEVYRVNEPFIRAALGGERQCFERTLTKADGSTGHVLTYYIPSWKGDQVSGFFVLVSDITDLKQAQLQLEQVNRVLAQRTVEAEAANRAKSDFLANMSHEIRTPMNAIMGLGHLALKTDLSPRQHDYLTKMTSAADGLLRLLNELLDFSKIEAGKLQLAEVTFQLRPTLTQLTNLMECHADEKGLKIVITTDPATPEYLKGDPFRLQQVLLNLMNNSVKFSHGGEVSLTVRPLPDADGEISLEFTVQDSGIGMTPDQLDGIFEPFTQGDSSTTRTYGGTGLGLSICRRLVTLLGGEIRVSSEPGEGSSFTFTARFRVGTRGDVQEKPPLSVPAVRFLRGRRILVAEDQPVNQQVIREVLEQAGMVVTLVGHGREAVAAVAAAIDPFDAVLMDIQMPVMDGYEAARLIRRHPGCQELPIIALTAHALWEERVRCLDAGMNDHLTKPIDVEQVIESLARWMPPFQEGESAPLVFEVPGEEKWAPLHLHGFDLDSALKRLCGNERLLFRLLRDFGENHQGSVAAIRRALERGEQATALQLLHSLRGVAGNLSAASVVAAAGALEGLLKRGGAPVAKRELEQLELALQQALASVSQLGGRGADDGERPADGGVVQPVDVAAVAPLLSRLHGLLTKNSIRARTLLPPLQELLQGTRLEAEAHRIEASLAKFDFGLARSVVEDLSASLAE